MTLLIPLLVLLNLVVLFMLWDVRRLIHREDTGVSNAGWDHSDDGIRKHLTVMNKHQLELSKQLEQLAGQISRHSSVSNIHQKKPDRQTAPVDAKGRSPDRRLQQALIDVQDELKALRILLNNVQALADDNHRLIRSFVQARKGPSKSNVTKNTITHKGKDVIVQEPQTSEKSTIEIENKRFAPPPDASFSIPGLKEDVKRLIAQLESGNADKSLVLEAITLYRDHYLGTHHSLSAYLEKVLEAKYGVTFTHAQIGYSKNSAVGFDVVKKGESFRLNPEERVKIREANLQDVLPDTILFELYPQVTYEDEVIQRGKVVVV